jgi:FdhD protein
MRPGSIVRTSVLVVDHGKAIRRRDSLATEEPLEIRLLAGTQRRTLAVTMRTPGNDFELAAGFLFNEGVVTERSDIAQISYCVDTSEEQRFNIVNVLLRSYTLPELPQLERHFFSSSACGVCGKASLEALQMRGIAQLPAGPNVPAVLITGLPAKLRESQGLFQSTGGLHAAALFTRDGELLAVREDVGRHNAVDKLIGWALLEGTLPHSDAILLVSGRVGFEIAQKCVSAGIPILAAVSAPSSLAVQIAQTFGLTLMGFVRGERFNVYAGEQRLILTP